MLYRFLWSQVPLESAQKGYKTIWYSHIFIPHFEVQNVYFGAFFFYLYTLSWGSHGQNAKFSYYIFQELSNKMLRSFESVKQFKRYMRFIKMIPFRNIFVCKISILKYSKTTWFDLVSFVVVIIVMENKLNVRESIMLSVRKYKCNYYIFICMHNYMICLLYKSIKGILS